MGGGGVGVWVGVGGDQILHLHQECMRSSGEERSIFFSNFFALRDLTCMGNG